MQHLLGFAQYELEGGNPLHSGQAYVFHCHSRSSRSNDVNEMLFDKRHWEEFLKFCMQDVVGLNKLNAKRHYKWKCWFIRCNCWSLDFRQLITIFLSLIELYKFWTSLVFVIIIIMIINFFLIVSCKLLSLNDRAASLNLSLIFYNIVRIAPTYSLTLMWDSRKVYPHRSLL